MIIVSGLNRRTGAVATRKYMPGSEGAARRYRGELRGLGYNTTFVNDVKERYLAAEREGVAVVEGVEYLGYQLHSLGTGSGNMVGQHIIHDGTDSLTDAVECAESWVARWSDGHKGIVIYKAIKLVRKIVKPTTEIVDLA